MLGNSEQDKTVINISQLNELTYDDIIMLIDHKVNNLVKNCKKDPDFQEGNHYLG